MMDDGRLLLFSVDVLYNELLKQASTEDVHQCKDEIDAALEQCFYCLYGHPHKRAKAKHLEDHSANPMSLTWDKCQVIFDFFKPKTLPEYDSYKTSAVSAELENLLRRISMLIPEGIDGGTATQLYEYIQGSSDSPPQSSDITLTHQALVTEIYYLLADYYFKNKEMTKAIKHYMLDVCVCPERFDSWAGMALARHSRLENKLSAHELKLDVPIQKHIVSTLRCFERALQLDDANGKLWIEYGSCAYLIHSHSSRLLKQQESFSALPPVLSRELLQQASTNYSEMLHVAKNCFTMAANVTSAEEIEPGGYSEEWLLQYMLGKIAEKLGRPPNEYLDHYQKASENLHSVKAKYPKKIAFYNVPYLAIESLEVYYRIHASTIKFLLKCETTKDLIPFDSLEKSISHAANQPFVSCVEKERKSDKRPDCEMESLNETPSSMSEKLYRSRDHTYFYNKLSLLSATSEAMSMNYWPVLSSPASVPLTYFHPMLTSPAAISLAPQIACQTSEMPSYFVQSPPTHMTTPPILSPSVVPALGNNQTDRLVCHAERNSLLTRSNGSVEVPLDLTVKDLDTVQVSLSEVIPCLQSGETSSTSRSTDNAGVTAVNVTSEILSSNDALFCATNSSLYTLPPVNRSFHSEPMPTLVDTRQFSETSVTVPAVTSNDNMLVDEEEPNRVLGVSTVPSTGSSVLQTILTSADTKPVMVDTSVCQHQAAVANVAEQYSTFSESSVCVSSADIKPVLTAALPDEDISSRMSVTASEVEGSVEDRFRPQIAASSMAHVSEIGRVLVASNVSSETSISDTVAQCPQPSDVRELSQHATAVADVPCSTASVDSPASVPAVKDEDLDLLASDHDPTVGPSGDFVKQRVTGSAETDSRPGTDNQLLSTATEASIRPANEKVIGENLLLDSVVQSGTSAHHRVIKLDRTVTGKDTDGHLALSNTSLEQLTEEPGLDVAEHSACSEERTDYEPHDADDRGQSVRVDDHGQSVRVADLGGDAAHKEVDGGTAALAVNTASAVTSVENVSESVPDGIAASEPSSAAITMEVGAPVADTLQQNSTTDDAAMSTAATETDKNQRFSELMIKCTKALELCLTRFPQHYKSLYRLADVFFRSSCLKDLEKCREILLGSGSGQQTELNLPCPGMFHERKQSNFFQGLWRIPSQEVDRAGSFAAHLSQALLLLLNILKATHDAKMLFCIHRQLATSPPNDRKYLRDMDRVQLSQLAFIYCLDALEEKMQERSVSVEAESEEDDQLQRLLLTYQVRQYAVKMQPTLTTRADKLLLSAYHTYIDVELKELPTLDDVTQFCSRLQTLKPAQEKAVHGGHSSTRTLSPAPVTVTTSQTAMRYSAGSAAELGHCATPSSTNIITSNESVTSSTHNFIQPTKSDHRSEAQPAVCVETARIRESNAGFERRSTESVTVVDRNVVDVDSIADYCVTSTPAASAVDNVAQSDVSSVDDDDADDDYDDEDDVIVISSSAPEDDDN